MSNHDPSLITIDCDQCIMQSTPTCNDCMVTHMCGGAGDAERSGTAMVFDLAERRAVRLFADAGMIPTLRHRAASSS